MGKHEEIHVKNNKKKRKIRIKKSRIFILILIVLAILGGLFAKRVYDLDGNWIAALLGHNKHTLENLEKLYVLVIGKSQGMTDTMIVCSYDPKTQEAAMLSIPRDTFIGNSRYSASVYDKINSVYSYYDEDPQKVLDEINEITGLNIKNWALIDTKALVELVNAIEGVEFNVPMDMKYDDYSQELHVNLKEGWQTLNGDQVEQLVRFRHNSDGSSYSSEYGNEDFGRMRTQREVIKAIAKQTIQLKNVKEVGKILDITKQYVKTNMNFDSLKDYIPYAMEMNADNIKTEQLPGTAEYINGISFFVYYEEETEEMVNELFHGITVEETAEEQNND